MSTYTESLGLELITPGSQAGLWGNTTNNTFTLIDQAITGVTPISFAGASGTTYTLKDYNGAEDEARAAVLNITGTATGANTVVVPNKQKTYLVRNETGRTVRFQTATPGDYYDVEAGNNILIFCDGNNGVYTGIKAPGVGTLTVSGGGTGTTTFTAGFVKSTGGTNSLTSSATVSAATELSGVTPVANGGTGQSTLPSGSLLVGTGTGAVGGITPAGYSGYVLTSNGSSWAPALPSTGGVNSVSSTTIGVSPTSGSVVITLSGSNVTTALGYTPYNSSNPSGYITSSALSGYATTSQLASYMPLSGGTFIGGVTFSSLVTSSSYNLTSNSSIFQSGSAVHISSSGQYFYFYANGNALAAGTWQTGSDRRIKENIAPVGTTIDKVMQLNPVEFSMKKDQSATANRYGLIAQELEQVFPYVVDDTDSTIDGVENVKVVSYMELIPVLVKAIQELKTEINELKATK